MPSENGPTKPTLEQQALIAKARSSIREEIVRNELGSTLAAEFDKAEPDLFIDVKKFPQGQSGAVVEEWTLRAEPDQPGVRTIFKSVPKEAKLREPKFYQSELYQEYAKKSFDRGGLPLAVHYAEATNVPSQAVELRTGDEKTLCDLEENASSSFRMLMEKGGLSYPGGAHVPDIPLRRDDTFTSVELYPDDALPDPAEIERRRSFAEQWCPVVIDELALFHATFWRRADLHPKGFWSSVGNILFSVVTRQRKFSSALGQHTNMCDNDPTPKIEKYPYLTGLGMLSIFESLQTDVGLVKGPKLWGMSAAPFRTPLVDAAARDQRYGKLVQIGDHLAETLPETSGAFTLVHNDLKYENILLRYRQFSDGTFREVAQLFDFDLVGAGTGPADLATFMIASFDMEVRWENQFEDKLLNRYCQQVWENMTDVQKEHYLGNFDEKFRPEVRSDYFRKAAQTLFVMNMLEAKGEKKFYRLLQRTLSWFEEHRAEFNIRFPINVLDPHYVSVDIIDQGDGGKLHLGILLNTARLVREECESLAEEKARISDHDDLGLNYALSSIALGRTQRKAGRIFTKEGEPRATGGFTTGRELLEYIRKKDGVETVPLLTVTDGSVFRYAYGDHEAYEVGDLVVKPIARVTGKAVRLALSPLATVFTGRAKQKLKPPSVGFFKSHLAASGDFFGEFGPLIRSYNREDKIIKLVVLNHVFYIVAHPELAQQVFQQSDKRVPTTCYGDMPTMASKGVFIGDGQMWNLARGSFEQHLRPQLIKSLTEYFASNCERMLESVERSWHKPGVTNNGREYGAGVVEMMDWVERVTYDSMSDVGFGYKPDMVGKQETGEEDTFIKVFDEALELSLRSVVDWKAYPPMYHGKAELKEKMAELSSFIDTQIIQKARAAVSRRDSNARHNRFDVGDVVTLQGAAADGDSFRIVEAMGANKYRLVNAAGNSCDAEGEVRSGAEIGSVVATAKPPPLLHFLLDQRCPLTKMTLGDDAICDQVITMLVAGHKTTTLLLIWSVFHLSRRDESSQQWQGVLVNELKQVFGDDQFRYPTEEDIGRLHKMHQFLQEVLRLASPVQTVQRGLTQSMTLQVPGTDREYELKPHGIKGKGNSWIFTHLMGMHHDSDLWGTTAMTFDPSRFSPENRRAWKLGDVQFNPFGGGRRSCLGNLFAVQQSKTVLAMMLRRWHLGPGSDHRGGVLPVKIDPDDLAAPMTVKKARARGKNEQGGVYVKLCKRDNWDSIVVAEVEKPVLTQASSSMSDLYEEAAASGRKQFQELVVIWGGQFGTTKREADRLCAETTPTFSRGCRVLEGNSIFGTAKKNENFDTLKTFFEGLGKNTLLVFLTPVYNGEPAPNMNKLFRVLRAAKTESNRMPELSEYCKEDNKGLKIAVLAIGNRNWTSTFTGAGCELDNLLGSVCDRHMPVHKLDRDDPSADFSLKLWKKALVQSGDLAGGTCAPDVASSVRAEPYPRYVRFEGDEKIECTDQTRLQRAEDNAAAILKALGYSPGQVICNDELVKLEDRPIGGDEAHASVKDWAVRLPRRPDMLLEEEAVYLSKLSKEVGCRVTGVVVERDGNMLHVRRDDNEEEVEQAEADCEFIAYEPGDHLQVHTFQSDAVVEKLCALFGYAPNAVVVPSSKRDVTEQDEQGHAALGREVRVHDVLKHHIDVSKAPTQSAIAGFLEYSAFPADKKQGLEESLLTVHPSSMAEERNPFAMWRKQFQLTFLESLEFFRVENLPLARLVELAPPQRPRLYSIASAPAGQEELENVGVDVKLCVGVAHSSYQVEALNPVADDFGNASNTKGVVRKEFSGMCSSALSSKTATGGVFPGFVYCKIKRHTHMRLPADPSVPIMMVATGTGLAPFLSFLEHRVLDETSGQRKIKDALYWGVRGGYAAVKLDYLRDLATRDLLDLHVAMSRGTGAEDAIIHNGVYVTGLIEQQAAKVEHFFNAGGGIFYVCGSVKMSMGILDALREILGSALVQELQDAHRIVLDVWG